MQGLQPTVRLALTVLLLGSMSEATALRHAKNIPWQTVRALVGGTSRAFSAPASASPRAASPATVAEPAVAVPASQPSAPAPAPAEDSSFPPTGPMPSLTMQVSAPVAADTSSSPAGVKSPCPCPPAPATQGNASANQDLVDVAKDETVSSIKDKSEDAQKDAEYSIASAGRRNLRDIQKSRDESIQDAGSDLAVHSDLTGQYIISGMRNETAVGKNQLDYAALKTRQDTSEHLDAAARKTMAYYIHMAKIQLEPLKEKMKKNGDEMTRELQNTITVSSNAERVVDKLADDAEVKANYSRVLWARTQAEVMSARIDANNTEDQVQTSALGTKYSTQAVQKATQMSRKAFDMATQANTTGNMIIRKVMKTKSGILDVTLEVNDALSKASKANIDAHQAEMVASKLNKDAVR